jgi:hypothetical protein
MYWAIVGAVALILSLIFAVPGMARAFAVDLPDGRLLALSFATPLLIGLGAALLRFWRDRTQVKEA